MLEQQFFAMTIKKSGMKNNIYLPLYNPLPSLHLLTAAASQEDNEYSTQQ